MSAAMRQRVDTRAKLGTLCALALAGLALTGVGLAWACSPNANISVGGPTGASGPAGSPATVRGSAFDAGSVVVHWNSASGPVLATLQGASWSTAITIPDDSPGLHYVVAIGHDAGGAVAGQASALFEITAPEPASTAAADTPAAGTPAAQDAGAPAAGAPAAAAAPAPVASATGGRPPSSAPAQGGGSATDTASRSPKPSRKVAATPSGSQARDGVPSSSTSRRGGGAAAGAAPAAAVESAARVVAPGSFASSKPDGNTRAGSRGQSVPSRVIDASKQPSARTEEPPSLTSSPDSSRLHEGPGSRLGIGVAMLALGLLAPLASFLVADVRRRRARTPSRDSR